MSRYEHHVFICENERPPDSPRGSCIHGGAGNLKKAFKLAVTLNKLGDTVRINSSGCLDACEMGPSVVIYPEGIWYGGVTVEDIPRIVEQTLIRGEILEDLVIADECLNNPNCPHIASQT